MNLPWNILVRNSHQTGENYNLTPVKSAAADEDTSQLFWQLKNGESRQQSALKTSFQRLH